MARRSTMLSLLGAGVMAAFGFAGACGGDSPTTPPPSSTSTGTIECKAGGKDCVTFAECCSGTCANQICTSCTHEDEPCAGGCCGGSFCANNVCGPLCKPDGEGCLVARDCCSNVCSNGVCVGSCTTDGALCNAGNQCCSGACVDAKCAPFACRMNGQACSVAEQCCAGACIDHACSDPACKPNGSACGAPSECCNATCSGNECCSGSCAGFRDGTTTYAEMCSADRKLADAVIACSCSFCQVACPSGEPCTQESRDRSYSDGCHTCLEQAIADLCSTQEDHCRAK